MEEKSVHNNNAMASTNCQWYKGSHRVAINSEELEQRVSTIHFPPDHQSPQTQWKANRVCVYTRGKDYDLMEMKVPLDTTTTGNF